MKGKARKGGGIGMGRESGGKKQRHSREKQRRAGLEERELVEPKGETKKSAPPQGANVLCTPVKWPMQIERHCRTVGVHVTVNEPISTSFLLFNAFFVGCNHESIFDF